MGISSKKQVTSTKGTTTPINPAWVTDALQGYTQRVSNLGNKPAQDYVAPASSLQNQAFSGAANLGGWQDYLTQAKGLLGGNFENDYTNDVVDTSLAGFDDQAGRMSAANSASAAKNGAFGGSRYGIREAQLGSDLGRERASLEAGLRSDAFDKGAANRLSVAGLLGQLGNSMGAGQRDDIATQLGAGETQRGIDSDQRTADVSLAQIMGQLYGQGQMGLFQGSKSDQKQSTTSSPSLAANIGAGLSTAASVAKLASMFSDRRLKRDIRPLDIRNGRQWYSYRYLWEDGFREGIMAQENPDVAIMGPGGFLMVDYGRV